MKCQRAPIANSLITSLTLLVGICVSIQSYSKEKAPKLGALGPRRVAAIAPLSPLKPEPQNGAYLNEVQGAVVAEDQDGYNAAIFDKSIADEMKVRFHSFNDSIEARRPYQLVDRGEYLRYEQANRDLADWAVKALIQWHIDHTVKDNLEKQARETAKRPNASNSDRAAAQTVIALSGVSKAIRGTTMNFSENTKAKFKYDLPSGALLFGFTSPIADAAVDWRSRVGLRSIGQNEPEKMSLKVSRRFEDMGASTGAQYGLLSQRLNYGLNKSLVGPLSAGVDQNHDMRDASKDETIVRLNFGTSF